MWGSEKWITSKCKGLFLYNSRGLEFYYPRLDKVGPSESVVTIADVSTCKCNISSAAPLSQITLTFWRVNYKIHEWMDPTCLRGQSTDQSGERHIVGSNRRVSPDCAGWLFCTQSQFMSSYAANDTLSRPSFSDNDILATN